MGSKLNHSFEILKFFFSSSDGCRFPLPHSDGIVRITLNQCKNIDPPSLVTVVHAGAGGMMLWVLFSLQYVGSLLPVKLCLNRIGSTVPRSQSNKVSLLWGVTGDLYQKNLQTLIDIILRSEPLRNVLDTLLNLCHKELREI